jgi:hypothetical protein
MPPGFGVKTHTCHPDLDQVEKGFEAHAELQHPDVVVGREADLLTGLNQPLDRTVRIFVMHLATSVETLLEQRLALAFVLPGTTLLN